MKDAKTRNERRIEYEDFVPSAFVKKFASKVARAANTAPILDVACGSGRNAFAFAELGCHAICVDINLARIENQLARSSSTSDFAAHFQLQELDLTADPWPFEEQMLGGIIDVDFLLPSLFPYFKYSLIPGGYLLIETVSGRGGNYLQLPAAGEIKFALQEAFSLDIYQERKVGPVESNAVTVKLLGRRFSHAVG